MALSQKITLKNNFDEDSTFANAYIKVESIIGNKNEIAAKVAWLKSADGNVLTRKTFLFNPTLDGQNFIAQAYLHLKSLPEFASASDC